MAGQFLDPLPQSLGGWCNPSVQPGLRPC